MFTKTPPDRGATASPPGTVDAPAVICVGLKKRFGSVEAVRGVDLLVPRGTVTAVLGPNGAGKTTLVRMLATLLPPDEGSASVAGFDISEQTAQVRHRIGVTGQYAALDERLTGRENLRLIARLHHLERRRAYLAADELLADFDLEDAADRQVRTYSGGMRRRLDLAASIIAGPQVLFLDEPTTGLDLPSRRALWKTVRRLVSEGVTVLLTTQYLEEADQLADDIVVIDHGVVVAHGTPDVLKRQIGGERLTATFSTPELARAAMAVIAPFGIDAPDLTSEVTVRMSVATGIAPVADLSHALQRAGIEVCEFGVSTPDLDEVFLSLTRRRADGGSPVEILAASQDDGGVRTPDTDPAELVAAGR